MMGLIAIIIVLVVLSNVALQGKSGGKIIYINTYKFPEKIKKSLKEKYPHLKESDIETVCNGLRKFFIYYKKSNEGMISMPSQVVDVAWHEFILFTKEYDQFCQKAFGKFLHHTPAEAMKSKALASEGIERTWSLACTDEKISISSPNKLPLLFVVDTMLNIEDGFFYSLDCKDKTSPVYGDSHCTSYTGSGSGGDGGDGGGCGG